MLIHIGSPEGVTLLEFEEEAGDNQETPQPVALEGEEPSTDELPECPKRQALEHFKPPMFYKISLESFMFDALGCKN